VILTVLHSTLGVPSVFSARDVEDSVFPFFLRTPTLSGRLFLYDFFFFSAPPPVFRSQSIHVIPIANNRRVTLLALLFSAESFYSVNNGL